MPLECFCCGGVCPMEDYEQCDVCGEWFCCKCMEDMGECHGCVLAMTTPDCCVRRHIKETYKD